MASAAHSHTTSAKIRNLRPVVIRSPQERAALGRLRQRMEQAVERILSVLDTLDAPDEDLQDGGDDELTGDEEPSLGWTSSTRQGGDQWTGPLHSVMLYDVEAEHDGREPDVDNEPDGHDELSQQAAISRGAPR